MNVKEIVKDICSKSKVLYQETVKLQQRGGGGSTVGPKIASFTTLNVFDFGVPLLSMHSLREMGGIKDIFSFKTFIRAMMETFYNYESKLN